MTHPEKMIHVFTTAFYKGKGDKKLKAELVNAISEAQKEAWNEAIELAENGCYEMNISVAGENQRWTLIRKEELNKLKKP